MKAYFHIVAALAFALVAGDSARGQGTTPTVPSGLTAVSFRGHSFFILTVDPRKEDLRLFYNDDQGHRLGDFVALDKFVSAQGRRLVFAANAGMFQPDSRPVGLLVQDGVQQSPLNLNNGFGNFYLKPNGVFLINQKHEAVVAESGSYAELGTPVLWATQSGPLLVLGGGILPEFKVDSKSMKIRSGVGVAEDGTIVFALSCLPVTFYDFATLFLTKLNCPNALFLDGDISAFYVPGRPDPMPHSFGPMFGLLKEP